ncbi:MAG: response regulator [Myxococcota bacterium]
MKAKILVIDDDPDIVQTYRDYLGDVGFELQAAHTRVDALALLETDDDWDVILLDERLSGPGSASTAANMLPELGLRVPAARVIVITGYAEPITMRAAFAANAWDYLQKDKFLSILLPRRVNDAVVAARDRKLRWASSERLEKDLRTSWAEAQQTTLDANIKGRRLEQTMALLFRTLPGLADVKTNLRNEVEELDLVITNESTDPVLSKEGSYILVECKSWSRPVGPEVTAYFEKKVEERRGRARLGILLAMSGFTAGAEAKLSRSANKELLLLLLDARDFSGWIESSDHIGWLKERIQRAAMRA